MRLFLLRWTMVTSVAVVAGGGAMRAQPQAPNSVQVGVPQGGAQNQARRPHSSNSRTSATGWRASRLRARLTDTSCLATRRR